ncbi:MAG: M1 family metallopeptidase [Candidatus Spechtbacterales bacterium]
MTQANDFRLPKDVRPIKYDLILTPDFENFTFDGYLEVTLEVQRPTHHVTMNAAELDITSAIMIKDLEVQWIQKIARDIEKETVTFEFDDPLQLGETRINMFFKGALNDTLCGFYRSKYTLPDGTERYMATTQFEAIDARRAFPCFDEPSQKAIFELTLIVPEDRTAISNMPVRDELPIGQGLKTVRFKPTPVMSTYLLAFMVGDLEHIEGYTKNGTLVRVFATPGKKEQCEFALEVGIKALEYFEDYFKIPYPLPKMDLVAVPDFDPGAMENWGLVTFREVELLFDQARSSTAAKQRIAYIIAHEFAHQWFGNLVTMKWWNDLWLNESFATLMGAKAVHYLFPEWKTWERFYVDDTASGLSLDGLATSHPIEADIKDPEEIGQIFDAISYSKGASVLRMLEDFLGEDTFRRGVSHYLLKHRYGNAQTQDLWDAFEAESGKPVGAIMDTWTKQTGYPVIEVKSFRYENMRVLELSQERFLYNTKTQEKEAVALWQVPFNISAHDTRLSNVLLATPKRKIIVAASDRAPWVKINSGQTGFFRVKYSPKMLKALYPGIESLALPTIDRLGIVNDLWALSDACTIPLTRCLEAAKHYRDETEYPVWKELTLGFSMALRLLLNEPCYEQLKNYTRKIFGPVAQRMGWDPKDGEGELDPLLRSLALAQVAYCGDETAIEEARQRFAMLCQKPQSLDPNLRNIACNISARNGGEETYKALRRLYRNTNLKEEQLCYLSAMGYFRDETILAKTLEFSLSLEVRHENSARGIISVANNNAGRDLAWQFFKDNFEELQKRYAHSMFMLGRIVDNIVSRFSIEVAKEDVVKFFQEHPLPEARMALSQALERVDMNIAWLAHNRESVGKWLEAKKRTT